MKPMPSLRRQHGWALILRERVTMTIPSLAHAGSVIEPVWVPPLADASKKDTAVKSARACDGPSAIHSTELLAATGRHLGRGELLCPHGDGQRERGPTGRHLGRHRVA